MIRSMMKSKIHGARVTDANLNYLGSITIDRHLMELADILPHEKVQVVNKNNGARFETYVISGEAHSGVLCLNGAAARLVHVGDEIIVISYADMTTDEATSYQPRVIFVDAGNKPVKKA
ncbi:MAG: aspartate 1-decarboxylase [Burkholderiales bacterium]|jgi:aspartate 1-decarboxylase|nr:aspartate 1-decarboxylase [Burkholderiales bacterium]